MYGTFGMPSAEKELTKRFKDTDGLVAYIDASKKGWVINWADYSNTSKVNSVSAKENMEEAIKYLKSKLDVEEIQTSDKVEMCDETV